jgi:hypothetical protein
MKKMNQARDEAKKILNEKKTYFPGSVIIFIDYFYF